MRASKTCPKAVEERLLSLISIGNHRKWFRQIWEGITGASTRAHPAPFPLELAERLVRMFSFVGDTVLDPFMGTGTTNLAAALTLPANDSACGVYEWARSAVGRSDDMNTGTQPCMQQTECESPPVLFLIDTLLVGGSEKKTVAVSSELANRGRRVHIAYLNPPAPLADRVDSRVPLVCLERRGKLSFAAIERLAEYVRVHEIQLILCVNLYPMAYALAVQRMRPRNALSVDVLINVTDFVSLKQHFQMLVYRCLLSQARQIVFGCQAQLAKWRRVYRLNGTRCIHIYNGVDVDSYRTGAVSGSRDEWLRQWGLDPSAFIVGNIGRLREEKNHRDLIRALGRLVAQGIHAQCLIVGDGPERYALRAMAEKIGLGERIVFAGNLADVRPAVLAMDVFVLTSKAVETFSNAALEAMAMARPVVLSDVGGAREMVSEGRNGYVYPKGDVDRLGEILKLMHDQPDLRRSLGDAGRAMVEERFSFSHMVDQYERLAFAK